MTKNCDYAKTSTKTVWTPSQSAERKLPMAKIRQEKNDGGKWWQVTDWAVCIGIAPYPKGNLK